MPGPQILLADNDADYLWLAQEFLEGHGYQVIPASNPTVAQRILKQEPVALAIVDYRLVNDDDERDDSGLRLAKGTARVGCVPRIILTKFATLEYARESLRPSHGTSAVADFVAKTEGLNALLDSIQRAIPRPMVFICYARPDEGPVRELYWKLSCAGFRPWMDKECIVGGEKWQVAIRRAIRQADFFVVSLSSRSVTRRGFMQKEIRMALDIWDEKLEDDIYLIPVRLEDSEMIDQRLSGLQWIDLFRPDGFQKLTAAIRIGVKRYNQVSFGGDEL